jgi:hypothetical protein
MCFPLRTISSATFPVPAIHGLPLEQLHYATARILSRSSGPLCAHNGEGEVATVADSDNDESERRCRNCALARDDSMLAM